MNSSRNLAIAAITIVIALAQQDQQVEKTRALTEKLATFIPESGAGFVEYTKTFTDFVCQETRCPGPFAPAQVCAQNRRVELVKQQAATSRYLPGEVTRRVLND